MFVYEVLYRGRPDGTGDFHVVLAEEATGADAFGRPQSMAISDAMTPQQAKDLGFDLPALLSGINAGLANQVASQRAEIEAALSERDAAVEAHTVLLSGVKG